MDKIQNLIKLYSNMTGETVPIVSTSNKYLNKEQKKGVKE